jgi:hypothetical protein
MIINGGLDEAITSAAGHALEHHMAVMVLRDGGELLAVSPIRWSLSWLLMALLSLAEPSSIVMTDGRPASMPASPNRPLF